jgi:hypothetical protein
MKTDHSTLQFRSRDSHAFPRWIVSLPVVLEPELRRRKMELTGFDATELERSIDEPRNPAKSVTVE